MSSDLTPRNFELPSNAPEKSGFEYFAIFWRRKWLVLLITFAGLGLGYLFFVQQTPVYSSFAQVLIIKDHAKLPIERVEVSASYDRTHETLIRSPLVIEHAVKDQPELASLPSLRGSSNPADKIISGLIVTGDGGKTGDIIKLEYESRSREECPKVLIAVVAAYQNFLGNTYKKEGKETAELIGKAKDDLEKQIKDLKEKYATFQKGSPLLTTGETSQNVHQSRLQKVEQVRSETVLNNSQLKAQVDAIGAALKRGSSREALNLMVGKLSEAEGSVNPNVKLDQSIEDRIFPLLLQEQELLQKYNYGADHPQVRMIRKNIELTRELLLGKREGESATPDFYVVYLASLDEKIKMNEQTIEKMTELFDKEQQASRDLASFQVDDENYRSEINRKERLFDAVLKRLEEINLVRETGGARVELTHPPKPAIQVRPNLLYILLVSGLLGVLGGMGLAYLVDSMDRRFRSPDEIRVGFGLPVFGHIPIINEAIERKQKRRKKELTEPGVLSPALAVHHHSKGRIAEAYRGVRTAVFFSSRVSGHKVVQITSPSPCDGKTTLSCNLAISIANAGKKVLLIDADFRRSRVHTLFGIETDVGMSSVIDGDVELTDAIRETAIENLSILTCGPRPSNPAELLTSRRFEELLKILREKYELVLIDSPPVLAVSDPLNVAPLVDGVIMVMRLTKTARHSGKRAIDALDDVGANILGIVVNGVGTTSGYGYGYGSYGDGRYSYENSYAYGRYGGNGDDKSYYSDDEPVATAVQTKSAIKHDGNGKR